MPRLDHDDRTSSRRARPMLGRVCVTAALAAGMLLSPLAAMASADPGVGGGDLRCPRPSPSRPRAGVLLLHPGAFWIGLLPAQLAGTCRAFADPALRVVAVDYPLRDLAGAVAAARHAAARLHERMGHRPVFAYGESAGGTLAALLAAGGRVDAAVAVAPLSNLLTWHDGDVSYWRDTMRATRAQRRAASPIFAITRPSPLLLLHSPEDSVVPFADSIELFERYPTATLMALRGEHLHDRTAAKLARRWIRRRLAMNEPSARDRGSAAPLLPLSRAR